MRQHQKVLKTTLFLVAIAAIAIGCQSGEAPADPGKAPDTTGKESTPNADSKTGEGTTTIAFADVSDVFAKNCAGCHGDTNPPDGVSLTSYDKIMMGVKAGDAANSKVVQMMRGIGGKVMPPNKPLPDDTIKMVEDWINAGAKP